MFIGERIIASLVAAGATVGALYLLDKSMEKEAKKVKIARKEKASEIATLVKEIEDNRKQTAKEKEENKKAEGIFEIYSSIPLDVIKSEMDKNIDYNSIGKPGDTLIIGHKVRVPENSVDDFIKICKDNGYDTKKYKNGRVNVSCEIIQNSDVILGNILSMANQTYFMGGEYIDKEIKNVAV